MTPQFNLSTNHATITKLSTNQNTKNQIRFFGNKWPSRQRCSVWATDTGLNTMPVGFTQVCIRPLNLRATYLLTNLTFMELTWNFRCCSCAPMFSEKQEPTSINRSP